MPQPVGWQPGGDQAQPRVTVRPSSSKRQGLPRSAVPCPLKIFMPSPLLAYLFSFAPASRGDIPYEAIHQDRARLPRLLAGGLRHGRHARSSGCARSARGCRHSGSAGARDEVGARLLYGVAALRASSILRAALRAALGTPDVLLDRCRSKTHGPSSFRFEHEGSSRNTPSVSPISLCEKSSHSP